MTKAPEEFSTTHGPSSHYARHADGTRMTRSFRTEVGLVKFLLERFNINFSDYHYKTKTEIPNAVFSHTWTRK